MPYTVALLRQQLESNGCERHESWRIAVNNTTTPPFHDELCLPESVVSRDHAALLLVLRVMTLVIACRIVTPAFSISFLDSADVMHTLKANWGDQSPSLGLMARSNGRFLVRVIMTPFARH